jgi:hypothetical protein
MTVWDEVAEAQLVASSKRKYKRREIKETAGMVPSEAEKKIREQEKLTRHWKKWRREKRQELIDKGFGDVIAFLKNMNLNSAGELVKYVRESMVIKSANKETRADLLSEIDWSIIALREKSGYLAIDDPLPGQRPSAFQLIREYLIHDKYSST